MMKYKGWPPGGSRPLLSPRPSPPEPRLAMFASLVACAISTPVAMA